MGWSPDDLEKQIIIIINNNNRTFFKQLHWHFSNEKLLERWNTRVSGHLWWWGFRSLVKTEDTCWRRSFFFPYLWRAFFLPLLVLTQFQTHTKTSTHTHTHTLSLSLSLSLFLSLSLSLFLSLFNQLIENFRFPFIALTSFFHLHYAV